MQLNKEALEKKITPAVKERMMFYTALAVCCNILPCGDRNDKKRNHK